MQIDFPYQLLQSQTAISQGQRPHILVVEHEDVERPYAGLAVFVAHERGEIRRAVQRTRSQLTIQYGMFRDNFPSDESRVEEPTGDVVAVLGIAPSRVALCGQLSGVASSMPHA